MNLAERNALIEEHYDLVTEVVNGITCKVPHHVDRKDLRQVGYVALCKAVDKYNPDSPAKLTSWIQTKVRGAVMDELRAMDAGSRGMRDMEKKVDTATSKLYREIGRKPTEKELAIELEITPTKLNKHRADYHAAIVMNLDFKLGSSEDSEGTTLASMVADDELTPAERMEVEVRDDSLRGALAILDERERLIVIMYHMEDKKLYEIGSLLGVTESRVSQLMSKGMKKMREHLGENALVAA